MDPITHTLTGAALGQAGLKRRTALAWPALLIGANLPDVDILSYFHGEMPALAFRRGVTHGVLAMAVLPVLLAAALMAWDRWVRRPLHARRQARRSKGRAPKPLAPVVPAGLLLVSAVAVWSHPLLDWLNIYGIRLLAPFSGRWFYGDALFIVDLWVWLALGLGVWLARARGPFPARLALVAFAVYAALMWTGSALARADVAARVAGDPALLPGAEELGGAAETDGAAEAGGAAEGAGARPRAVRSVLAAPVPIDPTVRRLIVETEDRYLRGRIDGAGDFRLEPPHEGLLKRPELAEGALGDPDARAFLVWSRYPYFEPVPGGVRVRDARYGWAVTVAREDPED